MQVTFHRISIRLLLLGGAVLLAGCTPFGNRYFSAKPTAQMQGGVPAHDVWCYHTLGDADCYAEPQNDGLPRLVAVDPPARTPLSKQEYGNALIRKGEDGQ